MVQPTPLHHVNGGEHAVPTCANCGVQLHDPGERATKTTGHGVLYFCKADPEHPHDSCLLHWNMRRH